MKTSSNKDKNKNIEEALIDLYLSIKTQENVKKIKLYYIL